MTDQAHDLRHLVRRAALDVAPATPSPRVIVVAGAQRGAGATSVAVNASLAAAEQGWRVVLVDADPALPDVAPQCGLPPIKTSARIGRDDLHEALVLGPCGLQIAPCVWDSSLTPSQLDRALTRLMKQIRGLGRHAEIVVVDAGAASAERLERFWRASQAMLLIATPAPQAIVDAYAALKPCLSAGAAPPAAVVINRASSAAEAHDAYARLRGSTERFLKAPLPLATIVPWDDAFARAAATKRPLWLASRQGAASIALGELAERWLVEPHGDGRAHAA